jgi:prephenate dehydrogenase
MFEKVRIVGSGLIGTSIGLALVQHGIAVEMIDSDHAVQELAKDLVGGAQLVNPDLVIVAVPISSLLDVIRGEYQLNPNSTFMDVCSVKNNVVLDVESLPGLAARFVPTHPMAGREVGGAGAARADLFQARSWIITPTSECQTGSLSTVRSLIELLGSTCVQMSASDHDEAVAKISHLPQITSSLLAKQLLNTPEEWLELAGQGVRDTTRIAGSDEMLWKEIVFANRFEISELLISLQNDLTRMISALEDPAKIAELLAQGRAGKALIPGKHGGKAREYSYLPIVIDDKPGQLSAIFIECALMDVNVEDLNIEHSPGQLSALITLSLSVHDAEKLSLHLASIGWNVHPIRK